MADRDSHEQLHKEIHALGEGMLNDVKLALHKHELSLQKLIEQRAGGHRASSNDPWCLPPSLGDHPTAPPDPVHPFMVHEASNASKEEPAFQSVRRSHMSHMGDQLHIPARQSAGSTKDKHKDKDKDKDNDIKLSKGLFAGKDSEVKLDEELYDVTNFYHAEGCFQELARSTKFEKITLAVIAINAVYIGVDADNNNAQTLLDAAWPYQVCDHLFCVFFTFEILVRFGAFARKRNCLRDKWFVFDSFLVTLMVAETWILTFVLAVVLGGSSEGVSLPTGPLRLLRLLRLSRLVRLLRALPELLTLVNGMFAATRAVGSSLLLMTMMNYVFSIVMNMFLKGLPEVEHHFGTLGNTMWTLGLDGTFMDSTRALLDLLKGLDSQGYDWTLGWSMICVFTIYILMTNITVMNMLIGVLCEVVSAIKRADDEKIAIDFMKQHLRGMLFSIDGDSNDQISKDELGAIMHIQSAQKVLRQLEVNPADLLEVTEPLYEEDLAAGRVQEVTREELLEIILKIRGTREVTMQDMVEARCDLRRMMSRRTDNIMEAVRELSRRMDKMMTKF